MGLAASRQLEERLHAVNTASKPTLLFEDPDVSPTLTTIVNCIAEIHLESESAHHDLEEVPDKYKSKFSRGRSRRVDRLLKRQSKAIITLNPSIKKEYELWKTNPSTILQHDSPAQANSLPNHQVPNTYHQLARLRKQDVVSGILHRFLCIKLHKLKEAFNSKSIRGSTRYDFESLILDSGLTEDEKTDVPRNLMLWTRAGKRYLAIANALDGRGSLILLPDDISPTVWEELLPQQGPEFNEMITHLKDRGICKEAKRILANDVAAGIERMMKGEWRACQYRPPRPVHSHSDGNLAGTPLAEHSLHTNINLKPATAIEVERRQAVVPVSEQAEVTRWVEGEAETSTDAVAALADNASEIMNPSQPPKVVKSAAMRLSLNLRD